MNAPTDVQALKPKDFATDQEVRWCPGCGDYAILKGVQAALAQMGARPENTVFVSGIGCSSRFPYYMETYGFHTIHGRAPAIATGVKLANPELDVWVITGDGDGLSIGGNHLLHILRRNVDLQILLFNNEIYGLTKGQYSPTSRIGTRSPSTPLGSVDRPLLPVRFALGAGASFVARAVDTHVKNLPGLLARAKQHKGTSFIEIYQNCLVYNDDVFADFTDREVADARQVHVEHGKPLIFGKERDKGIRLKPGGFELEVVALGGDVGESDLVVHDETNAILAGMLAEMSAPEMPVALGILYCQPSPTFGEALQGQIDLARDAARIHDLNELLRAGNTWTVDS